MRVLYYLKKFKKQAVIIAGSLLLFLILQFLATDHGIREISRARDRDMQQEVLVEGLEDQELLLELPVSRRRYTKEEAEAIFEIYIGAVIQATLAQNADILHIESDLQYMEKFSEYGISVGYQSGDTDLLDDNGRVLNEDLMEEKQVLLDIILGLDEYEKIYTINLTVLPSYKNRGTATNQRLHG